MIVSACSPVLQAMTTIDMVEATKQQVTLHNIPSGVMELLMEYMYKGETNIPPELLLPATEACDYLQLLELRARCLRQASYKSTINTTNAISWYKLANSLDLDGMKAQCLEILSSSLADVSKGTEFLELSLAEVSDLISIAQETDADTDDLLEATTNWVAQKLQTRHKYILDMLEKLCLTRCSIECLDTEMGIHKELFHVQPAAEAKLSLSVLQIASQESGNIRHKRRERKRKYPMMIVIPGQERYDVPHSDCWHFDEDMNFVGVYCNLPFSFPFHSVCEAPGGFVVSGGTRNIGNLCAMCMLSSKSWKQLKPTPTPLTGHGSIFCGGKIFLLGGSSSESGTHQSSVISLELEGEQWNQEPDIPIELIHPEVACVHPCIFLFDGHDTKQLFELNTLSKTWSSKAKPPPQKYWGVRMISVQGHLLIAGGNNKVFAQYSPSTDTWATVSAESQPNSNHHLGALVYHCQRVYLIGGMKQNLVEEYDFATRSWSRCDVKLPAKLLNLKAIAL